jgi:hypothetical protein
VRGWIVLDILAVIGLIWLALNIACAAFAIVLSVRGPEGRDTSSDRHFEGL